MEKNKSKQYNGFSLIEVLFYVSMLSVFILVLSTFWGTLQDVQLKGRAMNTVSTEAAFMLNKITQSIRNASSITAPLPGSSANSLTLASTTPTENPTIFDLNNGNVRISSGASPYTNLNSPWVTVTNLTFTNLTGANAKGVIRIQMTVSYKNTDATANQNYVQAFYATAAIK
jgi:type II secretory pathway pseudopilin PulG